MRTSHGCQTADIRIICIHLVADNTGLYLGSLCYNVDYKICSRIDTNICTISRRYAKRVTLVQL